VNNTRPNTSKRPDEGQVIVDKLGALIEDAFSFAWMGGSPSPDEFIDRLAKLRTYFNEMYFPLWDVATDAQTIRKGRATGGHRLNGPGRRRSPRAAAGTRKCATMLSL